MVSTTRSLTSREGVSGRLSRALPTGQNDAAFANFITLLLPVPTFFLQSVTAGSLIAIFALPVILRSWFRPGLTLYLTILAGIALATGLLTREFSLVDDPGRTASQQVLLFDIATILGLVLNVAVVLWCVQKVGAIRFVSLWSLSLLIVTPYVNSQFFADNPWKYGWALPVTILVFLGFGALKGRWVAVGICIILALSATSGYRSWILVLGASVVTCVLFARKREKRIDALSAMSMTAGLSLLVWALGEGVTRLALSGYLGSLAQARTAEQQLVAGNILFGGRPEWPAALELASRNPQGFGLGLAPSTTDYTAAIRAMPFIDARLQDTSTVALAFKSGIFAFHSVFWNFWSHYGAGGVALIIFCTVVILTALMKVRQAVDNNAQAMALCALLLGTIWDLYFSPLNVASVACAVGLSIFLVKNDGMKTHLDFKLPAVRDSHAQTDVPPERPGVSVK